jgi:hypothetical protein
MTTPLSGVRCVVVENTGDLTAHDVALVRALAPGARLISVYRPSTTAEPLAAYEVPADWYLETAPLRVPIGTGPVEVRNAAGRPAAVGEVGTVGTGDLVRRQADGLLAFAAPALDPLDTVATMRDLPEVRDAFVLGEPGALTAYVVGDVDLDWLRQRFVTRLPAPLIPRRVVLLDALPLTPAGDYDLAALASPVPVL